MTHPSVNSIVERLQENAVYVAPLGSASGDARWTAAQALREAATIISELQAERDNLRKYCSAAANDYHGMLVAMERTIVPTLAEAFKSTAKELRETSEFMRLAAEGRASGLIYDDELSKAKSKLAAAESSLSRIKAETIEECAKNAITKAALYDSQIASMRGMFLKYRAEGMAHGLKLFASAIRSLGSTGGAEKTAECNHRPFY